MSKKPAKPTVELHPPTPPRIPASRFLAEGPPELASLDPKGRVPRVHQRRGGRAVAKRSIYLSVPVDQALERYCGETLLISDVVETAVRQHLVKKGALPRGSQEAQQ